MRRRRDGGERFAVLAASEFEQAAQAGGAGAVAAFAALRLLADGTGETPGVGLGRFRALAGLGRAAGRAALQALEADGMIARLDQGTGRSPAFLIRPASEVLAAPGERHDDEEHLSRDGRDSAQPSVRNRTTPRRASHDPRSEAARPPVRNRTTPGRFPTPRPTRSDPEKDHEECASRPASAAGALALGEAEEAADLGASGGLGAVVVAGARDSIEGSAVLGARGEPASAVVTDTTSAPTDYTTSTTGTGGELCGAAAMKAARLTLGIGPPGLDPLPADELARRRAFLKAQREQIAARSTLEHGAAN